MRPELARLRIEISGAVQGVGFRPYIYRLAAELDLTGWVMNDPRGVFIEVEGPESGLQTFLRRLPDEKPPMARILALQVSRLPPQGERSFSIRHSDAGGAKTTLVLPDVASCADCLAEADDPADRRFSYPFTNCTNCGPRFSIITSLPYDRPNTTMVRFALCPECRKEYEDPTNRRFHAQPTACPACGPHLTLVTPADDEPAQGSGDGETVRRTAAALRDGRIVAVKGLGGFHLMTDARNEAAITQLRLRKPRRDKPFAVMVGDVEQARTFCEVTAEAEALLRSPEAPIVLLPRRANPELQVAAAAAPDNPNIGVMLAYTPLHHQLLKAAGFPIIATSGNLTDEPICTDEAEAQTRLAGIADLFLVHDRPIARHIDDSVAWIVRAEARLLRRARGYAPLPVQLPSAAPTILAVGGHLKNTVALNVGQQAFVSQHIGDLETTEALAAFERVIGDFLAMYEAVPVAIAHDQHPDYASTHWALEHAAGDISPLLSRPPAPLRLLPVQHHHAHLAACLADNGVTDPALGVIWDGTGYGPDGSIWGGEFLLGDAGAFERVAHLRPFRLPGGDAAIQEPRRVAFALLWDCLGEVALDRVDLAPVRSLSGEERRVLAQMLRRNVNCASTTSMGRLFDAVSALIGLRQTITFEGQAAMLLEFAADPHESGAYPLPLIGASPAILDWRPLIAALLDDLQDDLEPGIMSARFHNALIASIVEIAHLTGQPRVALSGGCFQNRVLTERAADRLEQAGFAPLLHRQVPPNDGGISLGQLAVAAANL